MTAPPLPEAESLLPEAESLLPEGESLLSEGEQVTDQPPTDDQQFAQWLAERAGSELLRLRRDLGFDDPAALKDTGDRRAHDLILAALARWRPADAVLSEEDSDSRHVATDAARLTADRVWIIDPLDGTREYAEQGRDDWAVHVALWQRDPDAAEDRRSATAMPEPAAGGAAGGAVAAPVGTAGRLVAGAVAIPARGHVWGTAVPQPAAQAGPLRVAVSRTRPPAFVAALLDRCGGVAVPMGSAGVKVCAVVSGDADAYVHTGGQYEWDSAAPVAVARAAGLHTSRVDGSPLIYNRAQPRLPDLLICRPEQADELLALLAELIPTTEGVSA